MGAWPRRGARPRAATRGLTAPAGPLGAGTGGGARPGEVLEAEAACSLRPARLCYLPLSSS